MDKHTETDRQTDKQTDRPTDKQTNRLRGQRARQELPDQTGQAKPSQARPDKAKSKQVSKQHEYALARAPDPNRGMFESGDEKQTHASSAVMIELVACSRHFRYDAVSACARL